MRFNIWIVRGLVIAASLTYCGARSAHAIVVYSENFESMTVDAAIPFDPGNIGFGFVVAADDENIVLGGEQSAG